MVGFHQLPKEPTQSDLEKMLRGHRLTTAEILYRMPDNLDLLQMYVWQDLDIAPDFPVLRDFLHFWEDNLDGPLHAVRVASVGIIKPAELRAFTPDNIIRIH
ncbi:hypothetical protein GW943_00480 [Candidatus Parcubacteria bacterium]|uniref:Protein usg n=1 Tax=Candidatus Kaiserbacteria bacterium CG10_big_fil_rev_8_21_14_0_10_47_16 TaxID=1974608 RepID=A0A2H0UD50_9BACT|nr:hypothetical protein [Candidatus Parcubacteria bacterium]PIR84321.1 MAG: hypothetical protein COU16_01865 [Candidatus Kaiserbacteria bacterium CG10_big_fil_rev_8_21_14_0_10_47_16]